MPITELQHRILQALLPHVPFDGWSEQALKRAVEDIGLEPADLLRAFPEGASEALAFFMETLDQAMTEGLQRLPLVTMKLHEKIRAAVVLRLEVAAPHREALRRALAFYALPNHLGEGAKRLYTTVDLIWKVAGDRPTDFSFYTKRMTLAGVYSSTLLYWLNDTSDTQSDTLAFLDRRLADVMNFHKTKQRVKQAFLRFPFRFAR